MANRITLSQTLEKLMKEQGLTAKTLAERAQVPRSTIGGWINGVNPHNLRDVREVARTLGCSFEYLIFGSEESEPEYSHRKSLRSIVLQNPYRITIEFLDQEAEPTRK